MKLALRCLVILACLTVSACQAQVSVHWRHVPEVVVVGAESDSRRALVDEALSFWNKTLEELGSKFRLPPATHTVQAVPEDALQWLSQAVLETRRGSIVIPPALRDLPGELTIVLGEPDITSFAGPFFESGTRRIVGIRPMNLLPMAFPNVARNVIVHELRHALGLGHNSDPSTLMCGRPAECRPSIFQSAEPRVFPLTDAEKRQLLVMYPDQWKLRIDATRPTKTYRIGALWLGSSPEPSFNALQQGLRDLGYVEGKNLVVEHRFGRGTVRQLSEQAAELVRLKVDLVLAMGTPSAVQMQRHTTTLPVVFWVLVDPVEAGLVASLARPQGNLTGLTAVTPEQGGKRLGLLKAAVPKIARVGVLWNPADRYSAVEFDVMKVAAAGLGVQLQSLEVRNPSEFETAFAAAKREGAEAVSILATPLIWMNLRRVIDLALQQRLPTIYWHGDFARAGGLLAYGPDQRDSSPRHLATMVDKILRGAKPADVPVQQPTRFEFVVNKVTAKTLGITIPSELLMQAHEVIE